VAPEEPARLHTSPAPDDVRPYTRVQFLPGGMV